MTTFAGKIGLVTGAASGIGAATARRLAADGVAGLVLLDRDADGLRQVESELGCATLTRVHDVADPNAWRDTETAAAAQFGHIDLLVANAGVTTAQQSIADMDFDVWRAVMAANLDGAMLTLRAGFRLMRTDGTGGAMVMVASGAAIRSIAGSGAYCASKAGAWHLARVAGREGAPLRIRVNAVHPGPIETPIFEANPAFNAAVAEAGGDTRRIFDTWGAANNPLGRFGKPEEVAGYIAFLLSDACGFVTGEGFICDGGLSL